MADLATRVCHLPEPSGVSIIRLDRFSPNFNEASSSDSPDCGRCRSTSFSTICPKPRATISRIISPTTTRCRRTCARYADPLVKRVHAWKTTWRHAELVSVDLEDRLMVFDTRPRAAAPVSVLTGDDRELYLTCDAITDASTLGRVERRAAEGDRRPAG